MDEQRQWHRWFGLCWTDFFTGTNVTVEMEKDLSLKQQLLDIVIIRKGSEPLTRQLPDGLEDLAAHNLITFKSHQDTLEGYSLKELVGHYVNYRKQVSPTMKDLLPEDDFRLFAVSVRYPQALLKKCSPRQVQEGVYEIDYFDSTLRLIVVHQLAQSENNVLLHLFSHQEELLRYAGQRYRPHSEQTSTFLNQLFAKYKEEGFAMPYTYEQGVHDALKEILRKMAPEKLAEIMSVEKRLEGLPVEKRLEGVPVEKRLEGVPVEKRLEGVPVEKRVEGISVEELLRGLSPEKIEELRRYLRADAPSDPPASGAK
jgi:hypothetical protein